MLFDHYQKRVEESKEFKAFSKKNKKVYLGAGFFILDYETGKHSHQLDYVLKNGKVATFVVDDGVKFKVSDQALKKDLPKLPDKVNTDLDALRGIVHDEMRNRNVTDEIKKIIAVLHILDNKLVWNLQCILNGLSIINVHVDDTDQSILKFEKYSLMDIMKTLPSNKMQQGQQITDKIQSQFSQAQPQVQPQAQQVQQTQPIQATQEPAKVKTKKAK